MSILRRLRAWPVLAAFAMAAASAQEVIPDFYRDPGLYPNRDYVNQGANEHIDPFTGALEWHYVDLHLPGNGGFDLKVVRSYNSASVDPVNPAASDTPIGLGWTMHFGRVLKTRSTNICVNTNAQSVLDNPVLELPDGSRQVLAFTGSVSPLLLTTQRWRADCSSSGTGGLVVYSPEGTRYDMTQQVNVGTGLNPVYAWYTTRITDRNGNFATVQYGTGATPQVTSVTASDGRSISFTWADAGTSARRITAISAAGQTWSYGYDLIPGTTDKYFLTSVTRPDGLAWRYAYNGRIDPTPGAYVMSQATYPQGGSLSYSWGFVWFDNQANPSSRSTVVTGKTRSAGGSWSFSYQPGSPGNYDTTVATTPSGTITWRHVGPNYSTAGTVWMVGLLVSKAMGGDAQIETYTWDKQRISTENNARPGAFLTKVDIGEVNAPVLAQRVIKRNGARYSTQWSGFDTYGNPTTVIESGPNGGSRSTSLLWWINASKWIVRQLQNESGSGATVSRSFDGNGNLTSETRNGITTSHTYDGQGNRTTTTFPRGLTHSYSNYVRGIAQSESQPEGVSISRSVSDAGNVTSETDGEGHTTRYGYDGLNRVTSVSLPAGSGISVSWGATSRTATRGALSQTLTWNGFGDITSVTLGGITRNFSVDALGRRTFESNPGASVGTSYTYDILDRVTRITHADGSSRSIVYGAATRSVADERGRVTSYAYRGYGQPEPEVVMAITAPEAAASVSIARNAHDLVTAVTQGGVTRSHGYNGSDQLTSVTEPETGTTSYGRDAAGNMTSRAVGASGTTSYSYDGQNRLVSVTYPGDTPSTVQTYDRTHRMRTATSTAGSRTFAYDANGNLTSETMTVDGRAFTAAYAYNDRDQLTAITYPQSGRTVSYAPDVLGRPTQVSGYVNSVAYWPSGHVNRITYANASSSTYGEDSRMRLTGLRATGADGRSIMDSAYGYDGAGNLTTIRDAVTPSTYDRSFAYDGINRITAAMGPWGAGSISYDGRGNILSQAWGSSSLTYNYDGTQRLSTISGTRNGTFDYDALGNVIRTPEATYSYDGVPNLRCAYCTDGSRRIAYAYDATQRRASVTAGGTTTYEMHGSNGQLLMEFTPALANQLVEHIYLGGHRIATRESGGLATTAATLRVSPNPVNVGQSVTLTAIIEGTSPTGSVTFSGANGPLGTATLNAGQASLVVSFPAAGTQALSVLYGGDVGNRPSASATVSLVVNALPTSVSLTATPSAAPAGEAALLTATVTGGNATGTVTFLDGTATVGTATLNAGTASLPVTFTAGTHTLRARYDGDAAYQGSTSPELTLQVAPPREATTTSLVATPNPGTQGEAVQLTATVTGEGIRGEMSFLDGDLVLGTAAMVGNTATLRSVFLTLDTRHLSARYSGSSTHKPSTSQVVDLTVVERPAVSTITLVASTAQARLDVPLTLTATVTGRRPAGSVTFSDGERTLGSAPLVDGVAMLTLALTDAGSHSFTARYAGDASNLASASTPLALPATGPSPAVATWLTPAQGVVGASQAVTIKVRVAPASDGALPCDTTLGCGFGSFGKVRFLAGTTVLGEVEVASDGDGFAAQMAWTAPATGEVTLRAQYLGTKFNAPTQAADLTVLPITMPTLSAPIIRLPRLGF